MHRHDAPQGTDNVVRDLGVDQAGLSANAALALKLNELIDRVQQPATPDCEPPLDCECPLCGS